MILVAAFLVCSLIHLKSEKLNLKLNLNLNNLILITSRSVVSGGQLDVKMSSFSHLGYKSSELRFIKVTLL